MQTLTRCLSPVQATRPTSGRREDLLVDTIFPKHRCLDARSELIAFLKEALATPKDARIFVLEVLKFILTLGLIIATGVVLLMLG